MAASGSNVVPFDARVRHNERLVEAIDLPIGRWGRDNRLTYCNGPYVRWAGLEREALLGRTIEELYGANAWQAARDAFGAAFAGRTVSYQRLLTHQGVGARWARVQVFPDRDPDGTVSAVYTIALDVHDDVIARADLEAARRRVDRFTENIPYPLTYVDRNFVVRFVNRAYLRIASQPAEQILGRTMLEVRGARRWEEHRPYYERALAGEAVQYTRLARLAVEGDRWLRTSYVPDLGDNGEVIGIYTVTIDVHELAMAREQLQRSVERDALTDVLSRRALMDRIDATVADATRVPVALFFIDLDGFKEVNDRLGHRAGDEVLMLVANGLQNAVRAEDVVGRFGGDEFVVLAPLRDLVGAQRVAATLLEAVHDSCVGLAPQQHITASIGYALAPADATGGLRLLQRADDAMYAAKRLGRNRAVHCEEPQSGAEAP
jgi:diguanylate cyclase (GGDEF)-like protein/PAS domain S-box-containing protein